LRVSKHLQKFDPLGYPLAGVSYPLGTRPAAQQRRGRFKLLFARSAINVNPFLRHTRSYKDMKAAASITAIILVGITFLWFSPTCRIIRSFDNFERNARKVITGTELAAWANGVLVQYPTNTTLYLRDLGTNLPPPLLKLAPELGPNFVVFAPEDTNAPHWLLVRWGSGFLGSCGFEIGPTNFTGDRAHHRWQDGVYSFNDYGNGSL
jgi:hypothetical protein